MYVCGQLSDDATDEIDEHLSVCTRCQDLVDELFDCPQDLPKKFIPRRKLGGGGFGDVFLCHDSELERVVAVKRIREVTEPSQWLSEARNASQVSHPNVVTIHEVGHNPPYIVMDYVPGEDLSSLLQKQTLSPESAASMAKAIAEGLAAIHAENILHRDLKPKNVLKANDGRIVLIDFGISADLIRQRVSELPNAGTIAYLAPEQVELGLNNVSIATDVYSLGVIFYQLLTGKLPFHGTDQEVLRLIPEGVQVTLKKTFSLVPSDLEFICLKAMAKSPAARFQTAGEFAAAIANYQSRTRAKRLLFSKWSISISSIVVSGLLVSLWFTSRQPPESLIRELAEVERKVQDAKVIVDRPTFMRLTSSFSLAERLLESGHFGKSKASLLQTSDATDSAIREARRAEQYNTLDEAIQRYGGLDRVCNDLPEVGQTAKTILERRDGDGEISGRLLEDKQLEAEVFAVVAAIEQQAHYTAFQFGWNGMNALARWERDWDRFAEEWEMSPRFLAHYERSLPALLEPAKKLNVDAKTLLEIRKIRQGLTTDYAETVKTMSQNPRDDINERWGLRAQNCFLLGWNLGVIAWKGQETLQAIALLSEDGQLESAKLTSDRLAELKTLLKNVVDSKESRAEMKRFVETIERSDFAPISSLPPTDR